MIYLIDNYDSFTYNVYQAVGEIFPDIKTVRNDEITIKELEAEKPQAIIISPGPGYPKNAGISVDVIKHFAGKVPILGICLGHQSIIEAFGGKIVKAKQLMHGKASEITIDTTSKIFSGLPSRITVARYHSLIGDAETLPSCLKITATDEKGQIMAVEHKTMQIYGLQFHPESILTDTGKIMIKNFVDMIKPVEKPKVELKPYLSKVADGNNLSQEEAEEAMDIIMSGRATDAQIASLLTSLRMKGETVSEIAGLAKGMREKALYVKGCNDAIDIVGTGGDLSNTFNISTTASFVIAGAGAKVAKHGNRSVSSKSGAADVLERLGVKITSEPETAKKIIDEVGVSFLFAQSYHKSMKFVAGVRRETGLRTVFNILGPLTNPARTDYILLGVYDRNLLEPMADVLIRLGIKRAMLVYGEDKLDEISISAKTAVCEVNNKTTKLYEINPEDYGFKLADKSEVVGGTPEENAEITRGILYGTVSGAKRNIVVLNAGTALYIVGKAESIADGIKLAEETIDNGKALEKLNQLIKVSNEQG